MNRLGYTFKDAWDHADECVKYHNSTYPTFVSSDGNVKIGVSRNTIFMNRSDVWYGDAARQPNNLVLAGIITSPDARGTGLASKAVDDFVQAAHQAGFNVQLKPEPIVDYEEGLDREELIDWYKRHGFMQQYDNSDSILSTMKDYEYQE